MLVSFSAVLEGHGHQVELVEISDRDTIELYVNGEVIFKCKISELDFGKLIQQEELFFKLCCLSLERD